MAAKLGQRKNRQIRGMMAQTPPLDITATGDIEGLAKSWTAWLWAQPSGAALTGISKYAGICSGICGTRCGNLLPVQLMGDVSGKNIWDLCAAPGGKTAS